MTINWNRLIPLILLAVVGAALIVTGAIVGSSELIVAGTAMTSAAIGLAVNLNAITPAAVLLAILLGGGMVGCGGSSAETRPTAQDTYCGGEEVETE